MKTLVSPHLQLSAKFDRICALENGWYQGQGVAPDKERLEFVAHQFSASYPETLALPLVTPTPQGNLLFEWQAPGSASVDLELSSLAAEFHAFAVDGGDIERDFLLRSDQDWQEFFNFLTANIDGDAGVSAIRFETVTVPDYSSKRNALPDSIGFQPCFNARVI